MLARTLRTSGDGERECTIDASRAVDRDSPTVTSPRCVRAGGPTAVQGRVAGRARSPPGPWWARRSRARPRPGGFGVADRHHRRRPVGWEPSRIRGRRARGRGGGWSLGDRPRLGPRADRPGEHPRSGRQARVGQLPQVPTDPPHHPRRAVDDDGEGEAAACRIGDAAHQVVAAVHREGELGGRRAWTGRARRARRPRAGRRAPPRRVSPPRRPSPRRRAPCRCRPQAAPHARSHRP